MPPNNNYGASDMGGPDDFVIVIDRPMPNTSLQDDIGNSPVETGYVTVNADDSMITATEDTPAAPKKYHANILLMDKFEPILLRLFPEEMKQVALMAPVHTTDQVPKDEVNMTATPSHPHKVLIKNAVLLFECFFHFKDLYPNIGRESMLYLVGKTCELKPEKSISLQELVGDIFDTLADSRDMFMVLNQDFSVLDAEDYGVRELAWLAESYVYFEPEEPRRVSKVWYKDPAVDTLWNEWQDVLKKKGLRFNEAKRETASERSILFYETVLALESLVDMLESLERRGRSGGLTPAEKQLLEDAMKDVKRLRKQAKQLIRHQ